MVSASSPSLAPSRWAISRMWRRVRSPCDTRRAGVGAVRTLFFAMSRAYASLNRTVVLFKNDRLTKQTIVRYILNVLDTALRLPSGLLLSNRLVKASMTEALGDERGRPTPELLRLY